LHRTNGALATKPRAVAAVNRQPMTRLSGPQILVEPVQGSLFAPNVIPISGKPFSPPTVSRPTSQRPKAAASTTNPGSKPPARRSPRTAEGQGELEFLSPALAGPRTLGTTVEAVIYCEAPVATPLHRALAAALDWTMVLISYGLFLLTFALCGGGFVLNRANLLIFGGALLLIGCTYGLYWTIARTETPGMRWTHLRLITFDGFPPETWQRLLRFAGSCLSLFTVLGALWSLADEEGLGWQDHMSRTFPTPHELESRVFRRG
jgi:uncharacterized RDD family membrane protein YckC